MIIKIKATSDYDNINALTKKLFNDQEIKVYNVGKIVSNKEDIGVYDKCCFMEIEITEPSYFNKEKYNG